MVKLLFLCRRRADLTHAQYAERLLVGHVPIALRHHPTLRKYVVNIVDNAGAGLPPLDSIGELSFDTLADFHERLYDSAAGERIVAQDVGGFMAEAQAYVTTEHVQKTTDRTGAKLIGPVRRRPDMSHAAFVAHWLDTHVPLALAHHPGLVKYVTNVVDQTLSPGAEPWDGFAELHFASDEDRRTKMFAAPESEAIIRADMARFIGVTGGYLVVEHVQKQP